MVYKLRAISGCYRWAVDPASLRDTAGTTSANMGGTVEAFFSRTPSNAGRRVYTSKQKNGGHVRRSPAKGNVPRIPSSEQLWTLTPPSPTTGYEGDDRFRTIGGRVVTSTAPFTGPPRLSTGYGLPKPWTLGEGERDPKRRVPATQSQVAVTVIPEGGLRPRKSFGGGLLSRRVGLPVHGCVVVEPQLREVHVTPRAPSSEQSATARMYVQCDVCMAAFPLKGAPGRKATCTLCGENFVMVAKELGLHESLESYPIEMASVWQ